jgi:uncharacterized membrane protein YidH (DUF202 family)
MGPQRILGIVLLIVGIVLLAFGLHASNSAADQITNTFMGRFTQTTMWYIIGGIALAVIGLLVSLFGPRGKSV